MSEKANENVIAIDDKKTEKKIRLNNGELVQFVTIWQNAVVEGLDLSECVERLQDEINPDFHNKAASTQAASLRKVGVKLRNFRRQGLAKDVIAHLADVAEQIG